ncbi:MAG: UDP-N-acetylglucosamine--N-acetylmuramyl-(pentapeptide) pyrophosphoryl-undecaprenol N-acetylglucosamine transferase [Candidatus Jordarchaeum sp.]|uniref:UDP-N-acetylglucosamine--N-acetylmuramyl- (pentapeptide) pyrophosphoryl-undecaprenol N-acetylglucosamine transferase n=1 Tax=Candidatus Jordarchaeum sp. TaxID=2823881 RepID=UPI004049172B
MRVYFAPNGFALGHAGRCVPIARRLINNGDEVLFSTYGDAIDFVKAAGMPVVSVPRMGLIESPDGTIEMLKTSIQWPRYVWIFLRQLICEIKLLRRFKPSVAVSDSRLSTVLACWLLRIPCILLLHQIKMLVPHKKTLSQFKQRLKRFAEWVILYSTHLFWNRSSKILVPDFPPPYTIFQSNLDVPDKLMSKVEFIGQVIEKPPHLLPSKGELRSKLGFDDRPLIFVGVSGTKKEKELLAMKLEEIFSKFPDKYNIVMTLGKPDKPDKFVKKGNLRIYNWITDRYSLLKACDLLISRSGHNSLAESMYYGKPSILIPTPAHTEHLENSKSAERMGISRVIQQKNLSRKNLLESVENILNHTGYKSRIKQVQKNILNLDAIQSVIILINQLAKNEY